VKGEQQKAEAHLRLCSALDEEPSPDEEQQLQQVWLSWLQFSFITSLF
jgi:hypothetical protein